MAYLDPNMRGTAQQARDQFNTVARQRRGSDLTDQEFNDLGAKVGVTGDTVTGAQYNSALDAMGWGDPAQTGVPAPAPGPTGGAGNTGINPAAPPPPQTGGIDPLPGGEQPQPGGIPGAPTNPGPMGPQTGGVDPLPGGETPGGGMPAAQATEQIQAAFQQRFGRAMTSEEQGLAANLARQNGWDGVGNVPQAAFDAVMTAMQSYNPGGTPAPGGQPGTPAPGTPGTPGTPNPMPVDPTVARQQLDQAFLQRFGRAMSPQEMTWLQQMAGYSGGPITQEMMTRAMDAIGRYTGNQGQPFPTPTEPNPSEDAARARLEELLKLSYGEVDMNSPQMKQQMDSYRRNVQQGSNRLRAQQAERAAQSGAAGSGGADVMEDQILQKEAEGTADFQSSLIGSELKDQRANLQQAIALALQTGQQDKARQLQDKLGTLDIDLRKYLGKGQLGLGLMQALMGDQQFYDRLGLDYANLQNSANQNAIMALLNGGY